MADEKKKRKIVLVAGSFSDLGAIRDGINLLRIAKRHGQIEWDIVDVCSAHRNGKKLRKNLRQYSKDGVDIIIAVAGKLAALFGDVDAFLRNECKNNTTRVIPVPLKGKTEQSSLAALYSVLEVPNHKLVFEEEFFHNPTVAFEHALNMPMEPIALEKQKPAKRLTPAEAYELSRVKFPGVASYKDDIDWLEAYGLDHYYTGKTRETFMNSGYPNLLFILATDRISIFDKVLEARIDKKGAVLTAKTVHDLTKTFANVPHHLVAYGKEIFKYLPATMDSEFGPNDRRFLMENMIVVKKGKVLKVEAIVRGRLTGSGWKEYQKNNGVVCGIQLPPGLVDGSEIPGGPIFTPSTKADYGLHDENITIEEAAKIVGEKEIFFIKETAIHLYKGAYDDARKVGIIIADTKFEFAFDEFGNIMLIDEVLTPDSSRFWPEDSTEKAMAAGKTPPSLDKQETRDAGAAAGVKEGVDWIPPNDLLERTSKKYLNAFALMCKKPLEQFQKEDMGIPQ